MEALRAGASDFVVKPFDADRIEEALWKLPQPLGRAFAQGLGAGFGLARLIFHALEHFGGLLHQAQRGRAGRLGGLPGKADDFLVFVGQGTGGEGAEGYR